MKWAVIIILAIAIICYAVAPSLESFNIGQVSPEMEARNDFAKYSAACKTLENMIPLTQGPATRRPGTKYVADANGAVARVIKFEYSTDDTYVLELTENCMRFYRTDVNNLGGQIAQ